MRFLAYSFGAGLVIVQASNCVAFVTQSAQKAPPLKATLTDDYSNLMAKLGVPSTSAPSEESIKQSLKSIRVTVESIQSDVDSARATLGESMDEASQLLSKSSSPISASSLEQVSDAMLKDSTQVLQASVDAMRNSLLHVQSSINEAKAVYADGVETVVNDRVPSLADMVKNQAGGLEQVTASIDTSGVKNIVAASGEQWKHGVESMQQAMTLPTTTMEPKQFVQQMSDFMYTSSAGMQHSETFVSAKVKFGIMISNTYELFGLTPPTNLLRSGAAIPESVDTIVAFLAVLLAIGSRQLGKEQTISNLESISRYRNKELRELEERMVAMAAEISGLNEEVNTLQVEIAQTTKELQHVSVRIGLERRSMARKLISLRRRVSHMQHNVERKEEKADLLTWEVLETKRWNVAAMALLIEVDPAFRSKFDPALAPQKRFATQPFFVNLLERKAGASYVPSFAYAILQV